MRSIDSEVSVQENLSSEDINADKATPDNARRAEIDESSYSWQGWEAASASSGMVRGTRPRA
ncbi:MAG: hypothetical protein IJS39_08290 [Synergistaceae bacterium]|nr:hypothetical protein [Synergistaceae bacterium]